MKIARKEDDEIDNKGSIPCSSLCSLILLIAMYHSFQLAWKLKVKLILLLSGSRESERNEESSRSSARDYNSLPRNANIREYSGTSISHF